MPLYNFTGSADVVIAEHMVTTPHLQISGVSRMTVGPTEPVDPQEGDIWIQIT